MAVAVFPGGQRVEAGVRMLSGSDGDERKGEHEKDGGGRDTGGR